MGNWKMPGHRGYVSHMRDRDALRALVNRPNFMAPGPVHVEHENGDDLRFSGGWLVIEVDYQL
ncbi:hypothetical protein [Nocardia sp. R6R-6]|uniref:hypothetical protein n=1 Tax=Nocardia sp. R6R-6 TaxID=3459303 RepID=UPI00403DED39